MYTGNHLGVAEYDAEIYQYYWVIQLQAHNSSMQSYMSAWSGINTWDAGHIDQLAY